MAKTRLRTLLLVAGPLAVIVGALAWWLSGGRYVGTDNAYVQADMLTVAAESAGRAVAVPVHANQRVERGELLLKIDDAPYRIAVAQAEAQLAAAHDEVEALRASYREAQAQLTRAQANTAYQARELERLQAMAADRFVSAAAVDAGRDRLLATQAEVKALDQQLARIKANLGGDPALPTEQHPRYAAAMAQLEKAKLDLAHTEVRAPAAGVVGQDVPVAGDVIAVGRPLFSLVLMDAVWVEANMKETDLTNVRPGQPATVTVDAYPDREWRARVASISPASGAEFALLPAQNATGNWVKVVQRIPVRLALEPARDMPPLLAGMSAEVEIDTAAAPVSAAAGPVAGLAR